MDFRNLYVKHLEEVSKQKNISFEEAVFQGKNSVNNFQGGGILSSLLGLLSLQTINSNMEKKNELQKSIDFSTVSNLNYLNYSNNLENIKYKFEKDLKQIEKEEEKEFQEYKEFLKKKINVKLFLKEYLEEQGLDESTIEEILKDFRNKKKENLILKKLIDFIYSKGFASLGSFILWGFRNGNTKIKNMVDQLLKKDLSTEETTGETGETYIPEYFYQRNFMPASI